LLLKSEHATVGIGNYKIGKDEGKQTQDGGRDDIGKQHPAKADPAAQDGDDLCVGGHPGGEKNNGNKGQKVAEEVDEVRDKVEIVIEYDRVERCIPLQEVIDLFGDIKDDHDENEEEQGKEECSQKFLNDIEIDRLH
jgi:hypothetical protein